MEMPIAHATARAAPAGTGVIMGSVSFSGLIAAKPQFPNKRVTLQPSARSGGGASIFWDFPKTTSRTVAKLAEQDDIAWASYRYPADDMNDDFGYIAGSVVYGDRDDRPAVAGALVLAVDTETLDQVHAYTNADGTFEVPIPLNGEPSNDFWIHIQPLDGDVFGYNLRPGNISPYIFSNTLYTDFPDEFYDEDEGNEDNPKAGKALLVERGQVHEGILVSRLQLQALLGIMQAGFPIGPVLVQTAQLGVGLAPFRLQSYCFFVELDRIIYVPLFVISLRLTK